ncbi:MAG: type VI secretion system contractile sheath large subunit [Polyangiaceae bacterium]
MLAPSAASRKLAAVSSSDGKDKEEGGIVVGGISFGVTGTPAEVSPGDSSAAKPTAKADDGPVELDGNLLPLRVVAVADLVPRAEHNAGANAPERPIRVDPSEFDALFQALQPKCALEVESVLKDGAKVRVDFAPRSMKDFRPDGLVREIPLLRSLMDGRRVLDQLRQGTSSVEAAGSELARLWSHSPFVARVLGGVEVKPPPGQIPQAPKTAPATDDVARILDMVDTGTRSDDAATPVAPASPAPPPSAPTSPTGGGGRFGAFIAAVAHSGKDKPGARPDEGIRLIDEALSLQLGAIVQDPEFRRLERAWRGLHLLASRTPKTGVKLELINARPDEEAAALQRAIDAAPGIEPPVSFAVVDIDVDGSAPAWSRLRAVADVAEANAVPVLTNASAGLFGHDNLEAIDRLDNKQGLFDAPERAPWRAEANRPAMLWVAMAMNRILARAAYDKRTSRIREAQVVEKPADPADATVWLSPAWAVATLAMKSFEKFGWPCRVTGAPDGGIIEDLPVRDVQVPGTGETVAIPTEVFFSTETQRALGRLGVLALAAQPNNDAAYLLSAATGYVPPPKRTMDDDTSEGAPRYPQAPLADQLFVARLAQFLQARGGKIGAGNSPGDVEKVLRAAVGELFEVAPPPGPELRIDVSESGGRLQAAVTVRPRRVVGVSMEEITLGGPR